MILKGEFGRTPAPVNPTTAAKVLGETEEPLKYRAASYLTPVMEDLDEAPFVKTHKDLLLHLLFKQSAEKFLKAKNEFEASMQYKTFVIKNKLGLHARPGADFVHTATKYKANVKVKNKTTNSTFQDGKRMLGVLQLAVHQGHEIEVVTEGEDDAAAMQGIIEAVNKINSAAYD